MTGFVLVDKPPGPTSHDVVDATRRRLGLRRVGHAGTLDPPASGLLVLGVGPATRLLRYVQELPKTYRATGVLGVRTTTLDAAGEVVSVQRAEVGEGELRGVLAGLVGEIDQVPPAVSAVKVGGQRAYRLAAQGRPVCLPPRRVTVYSLQLSGFDPPAFEVLVTCSAGTYVRSLLAEVGERLGCGAHTASLRRMAVGHLRVEEAVAPEVVGPQHVLGVEQALSHLPRVAVDAPTAARARAGQRLRLQEGEGRVLLVGPGGAVGVFEVRGGLARPQTVLGGG